MILFRADANNKIGSGHIMRCLSIAEKADIDERVLFITASDDMSSVIRAKDIDNIVLGTDFMDMESELVSLKIHIKKYQPSNVFVDSYYVTRNYLQELLECCHSYGGKLVYIDDLCGLAYPCDFLVNYNIYAIDKRQEYVDLYNKDGLSVGDKGYPCFLLGMDYVPLRNEFCGLKPRKVRKQVKDILISTGGADSLHIALSMVKEIVKESDDYLNKMVFHIVVGAMNSDREMIESITKDIANIKIHCNVKDMSSLMMMCDIAVSAAGSTLYELCATQTPTIIYVCADNQMLIAEYFSKFMKMEYFGDARMIESSDFSEKVFRAIKKMIDNGEREEIISFYRTIRIQDGAKRILKELHIKF